MSEEQTTTEPVAQDNTGADDAQPVEQQGEAVSSEPTEPQSNDQGDDSSQGDDQSQPDEETQRWAESKGLDPKNLSENELKLAKMAANSEKRMHETAQKASQLEKTGVEVSNEEIANTYDTSDPSVQLAQKVNALELQVKVRDFFQDNPDAKELESSMVQIVQERPHLRHDLDALYALAKNSPDRENSLKQSGGREALEKLAQKQRTTAPTSNAVSPTIGKETITRDTLRAKTEAGDVEWLEKNQSAINELAASGKL